ncbi:MAG: hypothetical protein ACM37Z_18890 [Deltaproteobacteria bacterium]
MKTRVTFPFAIGLILFWLSPALADYTLLLKNGRRITVQSYRDEGSIIKFRGLGGEIGIGKDQIQSIEKVREAESGGLISPGSEAAPLSATRQTSTEERAATPRTEEKQLSPDEERAKEEKEYQQKLIDLTDQLREVRDQYSESLRGTTSRDPSLLTSEEEIKRLNADATSRRLDAQNNPVDPGVLKLQTPSPFSSLPPITIEESARLDAQQRNFITPAGNEVTVPTPAQPIVESPPLSYTDTQKELSDLRNQAIQLEKDRQKLIEEMKQKNFSTGSMFLE